ncbi:MAG: hypothetical protein A2848_00730 [Candidatus Magasanikbacteria bacterium RIFCSPHIGHO2_01_FULL_50_8]|uniref:M23ase beta-sheet core domain-containing protein n=2 Tax=Candidatus Magasanikiibacteriota TaxID=1752731 RepID=A0A1F6LNL2_9BACT|nr:MAG: hypothetical protein A2848_00730 [Candidatus Magasanikbacteria bacterium RIFCSPHIGHO2_01_FULL_50_8]OGH68147.1 MAG: hypothetical protein A3C15_03555 [Candidatus Magasanikbacteria bacterium RIFCSPHIGHO2_02_FULL_50_9b]
MRFRVITAIFLSILLFSIAPFVRAVEDVSDLQKRIDERRVRIQDLQKQIDSMKKILQSKQLEKVSLHNQLGIINGRLKKAQTELQSTREQLAQTELVLTETQLKISKKEGEIDQQQTQIGELVRTLDFAERQSLVSMFASGKTLSDFFSAQDALSAVDTELTRSLITVMVAKQDLDKEKMRLAAVKDTLEDNKKNIQVKQDQLQSQSQSKAQLLLQTKQSEEKFQKLVTDLKRQYSATEGEIASFERQVRARLKNSGKALPTGPADLHWPTPSRVVTAAYHDPDYPFRHVFEHPGVDIRAAQGTPIRAAGNGIVGRAKNAGMGYSYVILVHNNKVSTLYGHLSRISVREDEAVTTGDIIGYSGGMPGTAGAGPFVTGPHLHFEVRAEGIPVNPLEYLP